MDITEILFKLTKENGVAGDEFSAATLALNMLKSYTDDIKVDDFSNVIANFGERKDNKKHIMLDAHIDEIGLIVTYITEDGFIRVSNCGGIDRRLLLAQQVEILGNEKVYGVTTSTPPHLEEDSTKTPKLEDIYIDTGFTKSQLEEKISLGDKIVFSNTPQNLLGKNVTSKCLDDRSGVITLLRVADMLKDEKLDCSYSIVFSSQEETGERGARTAAYKINPDIAIEVDVSFAKTIGDSSSTSTGDLGKGGMIGIGASLSRDLSNKLISLAKENNIPYQVEVCGESFGNNSDVIGVTRGGVKCACVSIPQKYMHTPVEIVNIDDIENSAKLIAEFLKSEVCK